MLQDIHLRSGKWCWTVAGESPLGGDTLELFDPAAPHDKIIVSLPEAGGGLTGDDVARLAREPDVRLWMDEHGVHWRISRIGPGTRYPYSLGKPHLFYDSEQAYSGLVPFDSSARLGDLRPQELRRYRDGIRDFGARRRSYRPPIARSA